MIAIVTELRKLGCDVFEGEDYCVITPPESGKINEGVDIDTYDDHRMAMAFSLVACSGTGQHQDPMPRRRRSRRFRLQGSVHRVNELDGI